MAPLKWSIFFSLSQFRISRLRLGHREVLRGKVVKRFEFNLERVDSKRKNSWVEKFEGRNWSSLQWTIRQLALLLLVRVFDGALEGGKIQEKGRRGRRKLRRRNLNKKSKIVKQKIVFLCLGKIFRNLKRVLKNLKRVFKKPKKGP